jgi:hypothetical protein
VSSHFADLLEMRSSGAPGHVPPSECPSDRDALIEKEAPALCERNWRHIDQANFESAGRDFIAGPVKRHGKAAPLARAPAPAAHR